MTLQFIDKLTDDKGKETTIHMVFCNVLLKAHLHDTICIVQNLLYYHAETRDDYELVNLKGAAYS